MKKKNVIFAALVILVALGILRNNWVVVAEAWVDLWNSKADMALAAASSSLLIAAPDIGKTTEPRPALVSCWPNESSDLKHLAGLLETSNAEIAALAGKLPSSNANCPVMADASDTPLDVLASDSRAVAISSKNISSIQPDESVCDNPDFGNEDDLSHEVTLNEIAWMGSLPAVGESSAKAANREWIELKNNMDKPIDLNGWQIADQSGKIQVFFGLGDSIPANNFYLLSRSGGAVGVTTVDKPYTGTLANSGDVLAVFDPDCSVSDLIDASGGWPGGDNIAKKTLERKFDGSWQTSALPGGTPKGENSAGLARYQVSVAIQGDGAGKVMSEPAGISCNSVSPPSTCSGEYLAGTAIVLTATSAKDAKFDGWSGGCSGLANCSFSVGGPVSITATFRSGLSKAASELLNPILTDSSSQIQTSSLNFTSTSDSIFLSESMHLVISQIQIAGAAASNDFVKIFNPTGSVIDVSGWKLRKRSSSGAVYSLRAFPTGTSIAADGYLTWANASDGFAGSINADFSSSETLSRDNSLALLDAAGNLVDAVAWGNGTNQYVEGLPYPTNPSASQILRRTADEEGNPVDTNNNARDFSL
ncbi:MAG: lamin tail domain-containing protein [Patescibacteria group bacterium]|nr:lamin tail domain-containing protein [Patescibacteria group bacterium]